MKPMPSRTSTRATSGVSRTVVREAVRILVTKGLLETRHGIGTTVRAVTREEVVRPMTLFLRTCGQEVSLEHLHQVRSILEVFRDPIYFGKIPPLTHLGVAMGFATLALLVGATSFRRNSDKIPYYV